MTAITAAAVKPSVRSGSWSCENATAEALRAQDFRDVAERGQFAEFGGVFGGKHSRLGLWGDLGCACNRGGVVCLR
jgi:hypothetical protein